MAAIRTLEDPVSRAHGSEPQVTKAFRGRCLIYQRLITPAAADCTKTRHVTCNNLTPISQLYQDTIDFMQKVSRIPPGVPESLNNSAVEEPIDPPHTRIPRKVLDEVELCIKEVPEAHLRAAGNHCPQNLAKPEDIECGWHIALYAYAHGPSWHPISTTYILVGL